MLDLIKLREGKGPLLVVGATVVAIVGFVGVAYMRASAEASTNKHERAPAANLGQAPGSESYNQSYQAKVEEMVTQRMKQFRDEQEQQQKAAAEQQKASLERQEAMVQGGYQQARLVVAESNAIRR